MRSNVDAMVLDGDDWREIDRELRSIAKRQRALDAEEAALLCVVARQQIWRQFGCATMLEYLELIFGYGPKVGHERVRVALALDTLPELREALANGDVSYSALRELTRVVTPNTQQAWLAAVRGKSVRQIEDLVRTHRKGDLPTDPGDPDLKPRRLMFEVSTATDALLREARRALADERGRFIEDDEFLAAMAAALLEGGTSDTDPGRAKHQVRVTTCDLCSQTYFEGGGRKIAVDDADAARAECDAQRIGTDQRATQDIAPKTRRDVLHRDGGKCTVPRCRSARFIEVHHIVPCSEGGSHDALNLTSLCDGHHKNLHDGKLVLSGTAPNISVRFVHDLRVETPLRAGHVKTRHIEPNVATRTIPHVETLATSTLVEPHLTAHVETPARATFVELGESSTDVRTAEIPHVETPARGTHVEARHAEPMPTGRAAIPRGETSAATSSAHVKARHSEPARSAYSVAVMRAEAKQALQQLGFRSAVARKCVDGALASRPPPATLEQLIRDALKYSR
ncbi:MAG: HNH endonuclease [Kofleriaceae bacterium]